MFFFLTLLVHALLNFSIFNEKIKVVLFNFFPSLLCTDLKYNCNYTIIIIIFEN